MSAYVLVQSTVESLEQWRPVFDEAEKLRRGHGAQGHRLFRLADSPTSLTILTKFETAEGARAFTQDPGLREAMQRAGVTGAPNIAVLEEVESVTY